ncbi:hypothetical protein CBR_g38179 [Chara braunii]|uniref:Protein kinase domain-containing protein n=1 Tax=Chara braunii TaxID=69332 RepID=A0A388LPE8_CHABU|nr:hypothetical protein CBR_g38179 [Chara braunii]|eukprot:GBG84207.1 hypothetical protein CBR_g38179 [Chara braunii]
MEHRLLAYQYMPNGSLQDHLHGGGVPLDWSTRMRIALGSARGLRYLHDIADPPIIHRDFKSSNILLDHDFVAKVADFGLATLARRPEQEDETGCMSTKILGTFGYVAPEYVMTGCVSEKSDVYSFGVVLLELVTGRKPVDMSQPQGQQSLIAWAGPHLNNREKLLKMVDPVLQGMFPPQALYHVAAIAAMCIQAEPDYRPIMDEVVDSILPLLNKTYPMYANVGPPQGYLSASSEDSTDRLLRERGGGTLSDYCLYCRREPRDVVVLPCGHRIACVRCASCLSSLSYLMCPLCGSQVTATHEVAKGQNAPGHGPGFNSLLESGKAYTQEQLIMVRLWQLHRLHVSTYDSPVAAGRAPRGQHHTEMTDPAVGQSFGVIVVLERGRICLVNAYVAQLLYRSLYTFPVAHIRRDRTVQLPILAQ